MEDLVGGAEKGLTDLRQEGGLREAEARLPTVSATTDGR